MAPTKITDTNDVGRRMMQLRNQTINSVQRKTKWWKDTSKFSTEHCSSKKMWCTPGKEKIFDLGEIVAYDPGILVTDALLTELRLTRR